MKKFVIVLVIILVMLGGVGVGVYLVQQSTKLKSEAAPSTTLSFSASTLTPLVGDEIIVTSSVNTGENNIVGVEMYIDYDPAKLNLTRVTKGTFFITSQEIGPTIDNTLGSVSFTSLIPPQSSLGQGQGSVAILYFTAKASGSTTISYNSNSKVGAVQEGGVNVLIGTTPLTLTIQESEAAPTNTPTLTPTPTESIDGIGGGGDELTTTPTKTPTPTAAGSTTSTLTPTPQELTQKLPDSGISAPTIIGIVLGLLVILGSLFLIFV